MSKVWKIVLISILAVIIACMVAYVSVSASLKTPQDSKVTQLKVSKTGLSGTRLVPPSPNSSPEFYLGTRYYQDGKKLYIESYIMPLYDRPLFESWIQSGWKKDELVQDNKYPLFDEKYNFSWRGDLSNVEKVYYNGDIVWLKPNKEK